MEMLVRRGRLVSLGTHTHTHTHSTLTSIRSTSYTLSSLSILYPPNRFLFSPFLLSPLHLFSIPFHVTFSLLLYLSLYLSSLSSTPPLVRFSIPPPIYPIGLGLSLSAPLHPIIPISSDLLCDTTSTNTGISNITSPSLDPFTSHRRPPRYKLVSRNKRRPRLSRLCRKTWE